MGPGELLIPEGSQQRQLTALSLKNEQLQTPQMPWDYAIVCQSWHSEHCCDKLLLFTVNTCFRESRCILPGRKKKYHKDPTSKGSRSPWCSENPFCLKAHPSIEPTDTIQMPLIKKALTMSWSNAGTRCSKNMNVLWCHTKSKGTACMAFLAIFI